MIYKAILLAINQCPEKYRNEAQALRYKTIFVGGQNVDIALISMPWQCLNCKTLRGDVTMMSHPINGSTQWRAACGCFYESHDWAWQVYFEHERELKNG